MVTSIEFHVTWFLILLNRHALWSRLMGVQGYIETFYIMEGPLKYPKPPQNTPNHSKKTHRTPQIHTILSKEITQHMPNHFKTHFIFSFIIGKRIKNHMIPYYTNSHRRGTPKQPKLPPKDSNPHNSTQTSTEHVSNHLKLILNFGYHYNTHQEPKKPIPYYIDSYWRETSKHPKPLIWIQYKPLHLCVLTGNYTLMFMIW